MANHLTWPRWVTAESERKIVQLNGATGTTLQKEPIGTYNDSHICVPLHDIYIILFAPVAIHAFNNLYWYILCLKINICSMLKKTYILSYFWNSPSTSSSDVASWVDKDERIFNRMLASTPLFRNSFITKFLIFCIPAQEILRLKSRPSTKQSISHSQSLWRHGHQVRVQKLHLFPCKGRDQSDALALLFM